mmetsp:Transcript_34501/g.64335  ORF Transcript_34501/g.64335 Transcript_34501/m.64335 type:complete len:99 (-) Transcript_34501:229-525(-)
MAARARSWAAPDTPMTRHAAPLELDVPLQRLRPRNPGPYFFITTLETHNSAPAPLGQFIPIVDVTTNFFPVHAWLLAPASLLLFLARAMRWRDWQANY